MRRRQPARQGSGSRFMEARKKECWRIGEFD